MVQRDTVVIIKDVLTRREERRAAYLARDCVRTSKHTFAHMLYPSTLMRTNFPQIRYGVTYVSKGRWGASATLGLLTDPRWHPNATDELEFGKARFGLRGVNLGLDGRYYVSNLREHEAVFIALGVSGILAPIFYETYVFDPERGYAEFG